MNPIILDTDGGVDDAQALLLLVANGRTPAAITTVFGNVSMPAASRNVLSVLAIVGLDAPVHRGAARPLNQPVIDAHHIHGEDGLGGAPRPTRIPNAVGADAVGFLRRSFSEAAKRGEKVDLLMIGPLTNLALALRLEPEIVDGVGQLTIMGGTIYGRGNTTPAAEFNIYADPEAAAIVFSAQIKIVVVPWETCVAHYLTGDAVDALFAGVLNGPAKAFSLALANHARRIVRARGGGDILRLVDPLAAAVALEPSIVMRSLTASVDVALAPGITRGMTVIDPSGRLGTPKVTVVEQVRFDRLVELYAKSIAHAQSAH